MAKIKPIKDSEANRKESFSIRTAKNDSFHLQTASVSVDMHKDCSEESKQTNITGLKVVLSLALYFLKKCWMTCSAAVFVIFVIYWCYGGIIAFILFVFALSGKSVPLNVFITHCGINNSVKTVW